MSTYEDDHNITNSGSQPARRHHTLSTVVESFLNRSGSTPIGESEGSELENVLLGSLRELEAEGSPLAQSLIEQLQSDTPKKGVSDEFLDGLERVSVKHVKDDDTCAICTNDFKSDDYPLIVRLPCKFGHIYDLECIGPWLRTNSTCPLCRKDILEKKEPIVCDDSEEDDEDRDMYG